MPPNLENSAVATGLKKVSFHFNPKEGQCQRMFKLPHNCTYFTRQQGNAQNPQNQASIHKPKTSRGTRWIQKRQRKQRSNCQHLLDHGKSKGIPKRIYFCFIDYAKAFHCGTSTLVAACRLGPSVPFGIPVPGPEIKPRSPTAILVRVE